jgi:predicted transcriptional regulator YheO
MKDKLKKALDNFVKPPETEEELAEKAKNENVKKVVLDEREGLIERVDRIYVTKDGKQLLREIY